MGNGRHSKLPKGVRDITKALGKRILKQYKGEDDERFMHSEYTLNANINRSKYRFAQDSVEAEALRFAWLHNCQRVAYAVDLRLDGYDVESMPRTHDDTFAYADASFPNSFLNVYKNAKVIELNGTSEELYKQLYSNYLSKPGARAIVFNNWEGKNSGHAWNLVRTTKRVLGVDGQVDRVFDPRENFDRAEEAIFFWSASSVYKYNSNK
ncbi:MAG: hypothetical protein HUJ63_09035 [Enterococcus sp.]|nr:hypothetical protein [Enterococcus sp.]